MTKEEKVILAEVYAVNGLITRVLQAEVPAGQKFKFDGQFLDGDHVVTIWLPLEETLISASLAVETCFDAASLWGKMKGSLSELALLAQRL